MKFKSIIAILATLASIPIVSALEPMEIFENEWVKFAILFAILFAVMYNYFIEKFNHSSGPTFAVSGGLSIFLTMAIVKRGILDSFIDESIVDWIVIGALIIGALFLLVWLFKRVSARTVVLYIIPLGLVLLVLLAYFADSYLPLSWLDGPFGGLVDWIKDISLIWIFGLMLAVIIFIWLGKKIWKKTKQIPGAIWKGTKKIVGAGPQFQYKTRMRRGGNASRSTIKNNQVDSLRHKGSFVSKRAAEKYAKRHGDNAAIKRFG